MDREYRRHESNGFFSGFILGCIVGGAVVFFLGTARGRRMLHTITQEGFDGASELRELLEMPQEDDLYDETEAGIEEPSIETVRSTTAASHPIGKVKRFFKGAHKRPLS